MTIDPHELRMATGQAAMTISDALDDEALALLEPLAEAADAVVAHLMTKDLPPVWIAQFLIGAVMAPIWRKGEDQ